MLQPATVFSYYGRHLNALTDQEIKRSLLKLEYLILPRFPVYFLPVMTTNILNSFMNKYLFSINNS